MSFQKNIYITCLSFYVRCSPWVVFIPLNSSNWCRWRKKSDEYNHWVFSLSVLQDKRLFPESRLRESFHVFRLSNRLCRLRHTAQSPFPWALGAFRREQWEQGSWHKTRWTSTDVPGSLAAESGRKRWKQSGCQLASLRAVKWAPVLHMPRRGRGTRHRCCWYVWSWMLQTGTLIRFSTHGSGRPGWD